MPLGAARRPQEMSQNFTPPQSPKRQEVPLAPNRNKRIRLNETETETDTDNENMWYGTFSYKKPIDEGRRVFQRVIPNRLNIIFTIEKVDCYCATISFHTQDGETINIPFGITLRNSSGNLVPSILNKCFVITWIGSYTMKFQEVEIFQLNQNEQILTMVGAGELIDLNITEL